MNIGIMSIGDELINGFTLDSNSSWLAQKLIIFEPLKIKSKIIVSDDLDCIHRGLDYLLDHGCNYIFITGGLGPTHDDITKNALSAYFKYPLVLNEPYYLKLKKYFKGKNIKDISHLKSQAEILDMSKPIPNRYGTALGMMIKHNRKYFFIIPGVPKEMKGMVINEIIPSYIEPFCSKMISHTTLLTTGIYESKIYDILKDLIDSHKDKFKIAFLPSYEGVKVRVSALDKNLNLPEFVDTIREKIDKYVYGVDNDKIENVIGKILAKKKISIAIAESCTGGYISKKITDVPGSSKYFKGSIVAYDNKIKELFLNVPHALLIEKGAVSREVALKMAEEVKNKFNSDIGLSTTGISGPTGGDDKKPVGLIYIAIRTKTQKIVEKFNLIPRRHEHRKVATMTALNMLRLLLK